GLCKVVDLDDLKEQDYSLSPGRYVGINNDIDMDFDYKGRVDEIRKELVQLNTQANELMVKIQKVEL
ncbi:MAG: SAM-dependent DNA methyltransferase, partial [Psychrobacter sp.]